MLNGNTLICSGWNGVFIEVTPDKQIVWRYDNPYPYQNDEVYRTEYIFQQHSTQKPKLYVSGRLTWTNVKPGATVNGSFQVQNYGTADSLLNWTIDSSKLTWGTWTFSPLSGKNLTTKDGPVTINVSCTAPTDKNKQFRGSLKVFDLDNASDNGTVSIILQTPYTPPHLFPRLWQWMTNFIEILQEHHRQ